MLKLYKFTDSRKEYWETWGNDDGSHTVHWGELGTVGQSKEVKGSILKKPEKIIQKEIDEMVSNGFRPIDDEFTPSLQKIASTKLWKRHHDGAGGMLNDIWTTSPSVSFFGAR